MVDALDTVTNNYRITFDRPGIGTHSIPDYEVLVRNNPTVNIQRLKSGSLLEHNPFFPKIIVCCDYFYLKTSKCYLIIFLSGEFVRLHFLFFRFQCSFIKDIKRKFKKVFTYRNNRVFSYPPECRAPGDNSVVSVSTEAPPQTTHDVLSA